MPRLPQPRPGAPLVVKGRPLTFSFFPVRRRTRRYGLNDVVFAMDPWAVIEGAVNEQVAAVDHRREARAFVAQARAFFDAASERTPASPLLTYYAFLNLGKALIRCRGFTGSLDRATHGLSEGPDVPTADLSSGTVTIQPAPETQKRTNVFAELIEHLGYPRPKKATVPVPELAAQVVVGHRLWREASSRSERFVAIEHLEFVNDPVSKDLWFRLWLRRGDLSRYGLTRKRLIADGQLTGLFAEVDPKPLTDDPDLVCLEQTAPTPYSGRATDEVMDMVEPARRWLWRIITAGAEGGYRRHYLHLTPPKEQYRQPQIGSIWMLIFFFGSVVRYRPQAFADMTRGRFGAWINDFVAAQPEQLLFMLASEFAGREVARPAIVG